MRRLIALLVTLAMFLGGCAAMTPTGSGTGYQPSRAQERPPETGGGGSM